MNNRGFVFFNKNRRIIKHLGFTLAEILITLGVVGVVAAITLPVLTKNYQKKVTIERLKSTYSTLYQAIRKSEVYNGTLDTWDIPEETYDYDISKSFAKKYFTPYLKNVRECKKKECKSDVVYCIDGTLDTGTTRNDNLYSLILANGVVISFKPFGNRNVAIISIDINGKKDPNTLGKDKFALILSNSAISHKIFGIQDKPGLFFYGQGQSNEYLKTRIYPCSKIGSSGHRGTFCGALIMQSNWKISDDYPW